MRILLIGGASDGHWDEVPEDMAKAGHSFTVRRLAKFIPNRLRSCFAEYETYTLHPFIFSKRTYLLGLTADIKPDDVFDILLSRYK
jgi:hypothetical protein